MDESGDRWFLDEYGDVAFRVYLHGILPLMSKDGYINVELNIEGVRCIHNGLKQACDKWAGGDPHEQADSTSNER